MTETAAIREHPVYLDAPDGPLLAIVSEPAGGTTDEGTVLCPGGWFGTSTNRNRLLVRLAHELAGTGQRVIRFDWHGVGESRGTIDRYRLDEPFPGDVLSAAHHLLATGTARVSLAGVCFGAQSALTAAPSLLPRLQRLALLSFTVPRSQTTGSISGRRGPSAVGLARLAVRPDVLQGLRDPAMRQTYKRQLRRRWRTVRRALGGGAKRTGAGHASPRFGPAELRDELAILVQAKVPTLLLFGENDDQHAAFNEFRRPPLQGLLNDAGALLQVRTIADDLSGFGTLSAQEATIRRVVDWIVDGHEPHRSSTRAVHPGPAGSVNG